jgi:hypothetical protein
MNSRIAPSSTDDRLGQTGLDGGDWRRPPLVVIRLERMEYVGDKKSGLSSRFDTLQCLLMFAAVPQVLLVAKHLPRYPRFDLPLLDIFRLVIRFL